MPDIDDPFMPSRRRRVLRPRPGAGRRGAGRAGAARVRRAAGRSTPIAEPIPPRRAPILGIGLNPLVQAASPLLLLAGQLRGTRRRWTSPACGGTRSTRSAGSRSGRAPPASRTRSCSPRATRCARARRGGAVDAVGRAERVGAAAAARGAAPRGVGRREVLRDARSDLRAIPARHIDLMELQYLVPRVRLRRQVPGARPRPRAARRRAAATLYRKIREHRGARRAGAVAALARPRGPAQPADPLRAVVGGRRRGAGDPRADLRASTTPGSRALAAPCTRSWRKSGSRTSSPRRRRPPAPGPTLKQLLAPEEARGVAERRGAGRPHAGHAAGARPVRVGQRDVNPALRRDAAADRGGARTRCRAACWSSATPTISRSARCATATTSSSRASAPSASSTSCSGRSTTRRGSSGPASARRSRATVRSRDPENRARNRRVEIVHVRGT